MVSQQVPRCEDDRDLRYNDQVGSFLSFLLEMREETNDLYSFPETWIYRMVNH